MSELRDQIAHAMGWTTGHLGDVLDAIMVIVDPIATERDEAQGAVAELLWLHAEAAWWRDRYSKDLDRLADYLREHQAYTWHRDDDDGTVVGCAIKAMESMTYGTEARVRP